MMNCFHLTTILTVSSILFLAETALTHPLMISSEHPVVLTLGKNELVCYMQTADGRTLNLSSLCQQKPRSRPSTQPQIAVSDVSYNGKQLSGRVVNNSDKTVHNARVNYEVLGENSSVIEEGVISVEKQTLSPGQTATFQTPIFGGLNVKIKTVEWYD